MERRSFLKFLLSTPLAAVVDYEKLLWVPKPMIVIPEVKSFDGMIYNFIIMEEFYANNPGQFGFIDNIEEPEYREITLTDAVERKLIRSYEEKELTDWLKKNVT